MRHSYKFCVLPSNYSNTRYAHSVRIHKDERTRKSLKLMAVRARSKVRGSFTRFRYATARQSRESAASNCFLTVTTIASAYRRLQHLQLLLHHPIAILYTDWLLDCGTKTKNQQASVNNLNSNDNQFASKLHLKNQIYTCHTLLKRRNTNLTKNPTHTGKSRAS